MTHPTEHHHEDPPAGIYFSYTEGAPLAELRTWSDDGPADTDLNADEARRLAG
jgi:hypothetical protein